ncbi:hypothetical protein PILCRDRAFT_825593 [Piloderma croceum F 1598]|uniref:Uncharacterized protein n=1 Tax=Piloderma croceum (strain F 1598) TaxID=765440 RepID=A0A0C3FBY6_PILCF|nr:hypothetical protein PILCRDRAFT_825593 [Piloderma croceum F 1598]
MESVGLIEIVVDRDIFRPGTDTVIALYVSSLSPLECSYSHSNCHWMATTISGQIPYNNIREEIREVNGHYPSSHFGRLVQCAEDSAIGSLSLRLLMIHIFADGFY